MELTLVHLTHSPWSQRARCALRHHGLSPRLREYVPLIGEPALRLRLLPHGGGLRRRVTVPVLFTPEGPIWESWDIARYADRVGAGQPLVPDEQADSVEQWFQRSERLLNAARSRFMARVVADDTAVRELMPPALARLPTALARSSAAMFNAKYGIRDQDLEAHAQIALAELEALANALADGRRYLLGSFSMADAALGIALQGLRPFPGTSFGPRCEELATEPEWCKRYDHLLRWRDELQELHTLLD